MGLGLSKGILSLLKTKCILLGFISVNRTRGILARVSRYMMKNGSSPRKRAVSDDDSRTN